MKEEDAVTGLVETLADSVLHYFFIFIFYSELISVQFQSVTPAGVSSLLVSSFIFSANKYLREHVRRRMEKYDLTTTNFDFTRKRAVRCEYINIYLCICLFRSCSETLVSSIRPATQLQVVLTLYLRTFERWW